MPAHEQATEGRESLLAAVGIPDELLVEQGTDGANSRPSSRKQAAQDLSRTRAEVTFAANAVAVLLTSQFN